MTNLRCGVKTCSNNFNYCCCLPKIDVAGKNACNCGETCCASYGEKGMQGKNAMNSYEAEVATEICCEATSCVHNSCGSCTASAINVAGRKAMKSYDTECDSFRIKQ